MKAYQLGVPVICHVEGWTLQFPLVLPQQRPKYLEQRNETPLRLLVQHTVARYQRELHVTNPNARVDNSKSDRL